MMRSLIVLLCVFSVTFSEEENPETDSDRRCPPPGHCHDGPHGPKGPRPSHHGHRDHGHHHGPPSLIMAIPECKDFSEALQKNLQKLTESKSIGSCPKSKTCDECMFTDVLTARNQIKEPFPDGCKQKIEQLISGGGGESSDVTTSDPKINVVS